MDYPTEGHRRVAETLCRIMERKHPGTRWVPSPDGRYQLADDRRDAGDALDHQSAKTVAFDATRERGKVAPSATKGGRFGHTSSLDSGPHGSLSLGPH